MMHENLTAFLKTLAFDEKKRQEALSDIGHQMVYLTQERIEQGKDLHGNPFVPSIRAKAQSGQTLQDTRRLFNGLTFYVRPNSVIWGTNVAYAPYLHYGARIQAKNSEFLKFKTAYGWVSKKEVIIPPRPFLGLGDDEKQSIVEILTELIDD